MIISPTLTRLNAANAGIPEVYTAEFLPELLGTSDYICAQCVQVVL